MSRRRRRTSGDPRMLLTTGGTYERDFHARNIAEFSVYEQGYIDRGDESVLVEYFR